MRARVVAKGSALLIASLLTPHAGAEPVTLRMAAIAPDGTAWARELRAFARDVESATRGELKMKWQRVEQMLAQYQAGRP